MPLRKGFNHRLLLHPLCLVLPRALPCHVPPTFISTAVGALEQVSPLHHTLLPAAAQRRVTGTAKHCPETSVRSLISCWSWQSVEVLLHEVYDDSTNFEAILFPQSKLI